MCVQMCIASAKQPKVTELGVRILKQLFSNFLYIFHQIEVRYFNRIVY